MVRLEAVFDSLPRLGVRTRSDLSACIEHRRAELVALEKIAAACDLLERLQTPTHNKRRRASAIHSTEGIVKSKALVAATEPLRKTSKAPKSQVVRAGRGANRYDAVVYVGDKITFRAPECPCNTGIVRRLGDRLRVEMAGGLVVSVHPRTGVVLVGDEAPPPAPYVDPQPASQPPANGDPREFFTEATRGATDFTTVPALPADVLTTLRAGKTPSDEQAKRAADAIAVGKREILAQRAREHGGEFRPSEDPIQINATVRAEQFATLLPLIERTAQKLSQKCGVPTDDMVQAAALEMWKNLGQFDPSRAQLATWAAYRIRGAMLDYLRSIDWVPRLVRSKAARLKAATESLERTLGRVPTVSELAERMELSVGDCEKLITEASAIGLTSLNAKLYETDSLKDVGQFEILADKKAEPPGGRLQQLDGLRLLTKGLNRDERLIIILYYYEGWSMKQIGETLALSESRISQMHSVLLDRLRTKLSSAEEAA